MQNHDLQKRLLAIRTILTGVLLPALAVGGLSLGAAGCERLGIAEITKASPKEAEELAQRRADLERDNVLVEYQKARKRDVEARAQKTKKELLIKLQAATKANDADGRTAAQRQMAELDVDTQNQLDVLDIAAPLADEPAFKEQWEKYKKGIYEQKLERYKELSDDVAEMCLNKSKGNATADDLDRCVKATPAATIDPTKAALLGLAAIVLALALFGIFRTARRRIDPVALAGQKLSLAVQQGAKETTVTGEYKGYALRIQASAPEVGEGDGFLRVLVVSKVDPHVLVRFGPVAPPTGLDLPDLNAPEVHDTRVPEGYKLRLSPGANADAMLAGDVAFQLRDYDPVDVRVHDGMCGVTVWQVPQKADRVLEFIDLAVNCAKQYPQT